MSRIDGYAPNRGDETAIASGLSGRWEDSIFSEVTWCHYSIIGGDLNLEISGNAGFEASFTGEQAQDIWKRLQLWRHENRII
jgi:hypothetical protein